MLSEAHKFMFIHIPKSGGNSINKALLEYSDEAISIMSHHRDPKNDFELAHPTLPTNKHSSLKDYRRMLGEDRLDAFFKFAVIRNPWDRVISSYFFYRPEQTFSRRRLARFIGRTEPVRNYVCLDDNGRLDADIDLLIRFEALAEGFDYACEKMGLPRLSLPHLNQSPHTHYRDYYNHETRQLVEKQFAEEIEYGNYSF